MCRSECFERQTKSHNKNQSKYNFSIHNSIFVDFEESAQAHTHMGVFSYVTKIEKKNMNIVELRSRLARYWKCSMRAGKAFAKKRLHMDLKLSVS